MHGLWEMRMVGVRNPWGCGELAKMLDSYTDEQIAEICKGDLYTWGEESARYAALVYRTYPAGCVVDSEEFHARFQKSAEEQIVKAGYRLAKIFNDILK